MKPLLIVFVCLLLTTACSRQHLEIFPPLSDNSMMSKDIPAEQLKKDVDALYQGVLARHPALAEYTDLAILKAQVEQTKEAINGPMNRVEFYRLVGQLSHHFKDGHSFLIWPYQELQQHREDGDMVFPFSVEINADGLFIKHEYHFDGKVIPAGTQVLKINQLSSNALIEQAQRYVGGETRVLREQFVAARFAQTLWSVFGFINDFELVVKNDGKQQRISLGQGDSWTASTAQTTEDSAFYYHVVNDDTGYLYIGHFDIDPDWFEDFIDQTFATIGQQNISSLIIDIRDNTGGNTDTATYLSRYVADKPFQLVSAVKEKLNADNRGIFNYKGEAGDVINTAWDDWESPIDEALRFGGDTYLLVSQVSYSSAIVFATTLKDNGFATLVGQTTGGYANQSAQGNLFSLPHSELRAYVATRLLLRPSGDSSVQGVVPDVETRHDKDSVQSGADTEINTVMALIQSKNGQAPQQHVASEQE